jgi:hypothetical protein
MEKESFVFYKSFHTALSELPDEIRLKLYDMISTYALFGVELECNGIEKAVFTLIKPQVDANNQRYENGCRGGAPKGNKNAQKKEVVSTKNNRATTKKQPRNNQKQPNENDNENENDIIPPFYSPLNGEKKEKTPADEFFEKYPRYAKDRSKMRADVDYKRLMEEFEKSTYLRNLYTVKQINEIYPCILTGDYRDQEKKHSSVIDADARADRERWYAERRQKAIGDAEKIYKRFMQDEEFAKIEKRLREIVCEQAKAEVKGDKNTLAKLEREKARLSLQKRGIIERNGMTEEDLEPKWHCAKCKDTGFVNGYHCDCYEG